MKFLLIKPITHYWFYSYCKNLRKPVTYIRLILVIKTYLFACFYFKAYFFALVPNHHTWCLPSFSIIDMILGCAILAHLTSLWCKKVHFYAKWRKSKSISILRLPKFFNNSGRKFVCFYNWCLIHQSFNWPLGINDVIMGYAGHICAFRFRNSVGNFCCLSNIHVQWHFTFGHTMAKGWWHWIS